MNWGSLFFLLAVVFFIVFGVEAACRDKLDTCDRAVKYCRSPKVAETLRENCEKTCGHCTPSFRRSPAKKHRSKKKRKKPAKRKPRKKPAKKPSKKQPPKQPPAGKPPTQPPAKS
ncbi:hypothetical protein M3Y99_00743900 [Aphelenchoides fujianensis]|nr:hypothetical protein M3Y99_00743900 [Aphelenchoides fujianensis]